MTPSQARHLFGAAPVARLATVRPDGSPHVVPVVFAVAGPDTVVTAVDHKPKRTVALQRLANIAFEPRVSLLADHYDDDWTALWWVRADGTALVVPAADPAGRDAVDRLVARHPQYAGRRPDGPVIVVTVTRWTGWSVT